MHIYMFYEEHFKPIVFLNLLSLSAQDFIILKSTDKIKCKVVEITDVQVKYRKWSNQNGPIYGISKTDIFMIKYENGEKESFQTHKEVNRIETKPDIQTETNSDNTQTSIEKEKKVSEEIDREIPLTKC